MEKKQIHFWSVCLSILVMAILSRVIPHPANMTLIASIGVMAGILYSRKVATILTLLALIVSDIALNAFSQWTFFIYSGFLALILLYPEIKGRPFATVVKRAIFAALFYFSWTNLGVFFYSGIYPLTISGLNLCYKMALPFLWPAILGDIIGSSLFYFLFAKNSFYLKRLFHKISFFNR